jgi:hypothetical protein
MLPRIPLCRPFIGALACALLEVGCDTQETPTPESDLMENRSISASVDTLLLLLSVQIEVPEGDPLSDRNGKYLDPRQIDTVELLVSGQPWGTYQAEDRQGTTLEEDGQVGSWKLVGEKGLALVIADLDKNLDQQDHPLDTVAEWVDFIRQRLTPGGYVAELTSLTLASEQGTKLLLEPHLLLPFQIGQGETSALIGEATVPIDSLEGAAP